jgi:hypothetical protein
MLNLQSPSCAVNHPDPIIALEIPLIRKIIRDETWLEGERRGCLVVSWDPVVQERVCKVVLRVGLEMMGSVTAQMAFDPVPSGGSTHAPFIDRAA